MTTNEREEFDSEPLWSDQGQVSWLLERRSADDDLLRAAEIASELKMPQSRVAPALEQLRDEGKARSRRVGRSEMWGNVEQLRRLDAAAREADAADRAEQQRIEEHNRALDELRQDLEQVFAGRPVEITSLESMFPRYRGQPRRDHLMIGISRPEDGTWLLGRLRHPAPDEGKPTDDEWSDLVEHLDDMLGCLSWAGWVSYEDDYWLDYDRDSGPLIGVQLRRTFMAIDVEFEPARGQLRLLPYEDVTGEWPPMYSMLDDDLIVAIGQGAERDRVTVYRVAGSAGLLDATHVSIDEDQPAALSEFITQQDIDWLYQPAAADRGIPIEQLLHEISNDTTLSPFLDVMRTMIAPDVLPDCVPDAAAIGIAAWCWRNDTAVEAWHLPDDVLMARVNMAVTAAIQPHVDPFEGIDWTSIKAALTDRSLQLADGRVVADLFEDGWIEVRDTVIERLDAWQRIDEQILGPEATMRLLTIGGSTSYTRHWWGQGRWPAICSRILADAVDANVALPPPYDDEGPDALKAALEEPQSLPDNVLDWLIDMPDGGTDGPRGLRYHKATRPAVRLLDLEFHDNEP